MVQPNRCTIMSNYENLKVWQRSIMLARDIYQLTRSKTQGARRKTQGVRGKGQVEEIVGSTKSLHYYE